ncbi:UBP1-associated protein 2B-like isoform X1 [Momordica charantia]|uniref:UBP1-associated protein 2B-like isoform X1 n=2 Tax=Momordica charantia TaxID=3673 RepID=A0A6J1C456_MOMCH|nr:UBP1-associated protein 2B-like isoform X1 [Momordica charantia]
MEGTDKTTKRKLVKKSENKVDKKLKKELDGPVSPLQFHPQDDGSDSDLEDLPKLLEPFSKSQLIEFICSTALKDPNLQAQIRAAADRDVTHRKIFVHGLGWDTTRETLTSVFESFGEIEDCNVVMDKNTGKAKGYGFILFKSRQGATKALKEPRKKINNRMTSCQLASLGSVPPPQSQEVGPRKIYVANVQHNVDAERLRAFFAKFGELEMGPIGFDQETGKSRGYAIFIYKTNEGAKKVLEEPYKMFEGNKLHCQRASEGKNKNQNSTQAAQSLAQTQQPVMTAMAAAPNLQLFAQHPSLNPVYGGFGSPALGAGILNQGVVPMSQVGLVGSSVGAGIGLSGYSGGSYGLSQLGAGGSSLLGSYGPGASSLKGLPHMYTSTMLGKTVSDQGQAAAGGSLGGYTSHLCFSVGNK